MADASGILTKMGIATRTGWDDAFAQPVAAAVPFLSEGLTAAYERIQNETLEGMGGKRASEQGNQTINGNTEHHLNYNSLDMFAGYAMGNDTAGTILITDTLYQLFFSFEFEKIAARHRFWPVIATGFTVSGEKGGNIKLTMNWAARRFESVQTAAAMTALVTNVIVKFDQLRFRLGNQVDALAAGDELGLESFEISFDRNSKVDDYESSSTAADVKQPLEPLENGFRGCGFKIKLPRTDSTVGALFDGWKAADTALQGEFYFDGPSTYTKTIQFPNIRLTEGFDTPIGGGSVLTLEGGFEAYRSESGNPMYVGNEMKWLYT